MSRSPGSSFICNTNYKHSNGQETIKYSILCVEWLSAEASTTIQAGFLTYRSTYLPAFSYVKHTMAICEVTLCLQWPDRSGVTPDSLFTRRRLATCWTRMWGDYSTGQIKRKGAYLNRREGFSDKVYPRVKVSLCVLIWHGFSSVLLWKK